MTKARPLAVDSTLASGRPVFVFGSNLAGRHGKGAALHAKREHRAVHGVGVGRTGNAYAIPTKDAALRTLPLSGIMGYVLEFLRYAKAHPDLRFEVTRIGCGLAGYTDAQMAPMFADARRTATCRRAGASMHEA